MGVSQNQHQPYSLFLLVAKQASAMASAASVVEDDGGGVSKPGAGSTSQKPQESVHKELVGFLRSPRVDVMTCLCNTCAPEVVKRVDVWTDWLSAVCVAAGSTGSRTNSCAAQCK